ncbi:glutathione S-transferase family protein [Exilibacterium tricleocarpae]|uniref:Glutathione S-transferase family protein n=1 Tax=Exilibacterium tricleocarpae TaxID=2591008 RepID=A0A545SQ39_9GAMM|nr:glutathione S-transferase family protein [Exilibacterium tricleocarpae]TQV66986.1 glutathione S-transferase family protein [Exilibacterium tricleocarpae]
MGLLVKGEWHTDWYDTSATGGEFVRQDSQFRHTLKPEADGDGFVAEAGRYHLFVSLACPWAHRTLILRKLKRLEDVIGVTVVKPEMLENGWEIAEPGPIADIQYLYQVYTTADPHYSGRVTVPVLWDKKTGTIVNNESSEIIRLLNSAFNDFTDVKTDYYPSALRDEIDAVNATVYDNINNGVYKAGFATTQRAYERAFGKLFATLDDLEQRLDQRRYLAGDQVTEADWRLFTTLIRFDSVYHGHFKTNLRRIEDYPNLSNYLRDLYQQPGVAETVNFDHIKTHYYYSHDTINPTRVVPLGPQIEYSTPHDRDRF